MTRVMTAPAPSVGAADRIRMPASPSEHPPRRVAFFALVAVLVAGTASGGVWFLASGGMEEAKPRLLSLKTGPLSAMPDLLDGVPALVRPAASPSDDRGIARALAKGDAAPPVAEAAGRRAMDATLASAGVTPSGPSPRAAGSAPTDASRLDQPANPEPTRPVRAVTVPGATASLAPPSAMTRPEPVPAVPAPSAPVRPAPVEPPRAAAPTVPADARREAAVPTPPDAPLPPRRPAFPAAEVASIPTPPRPAATDRSSPARVREAVSRPAAAEAKPASPRRVAEAEEERSVLGVPVPAFVPTGRDISNAASSISSAVTGLAGF